VPPRLAGLQDLPDRQVVKVAAPRVKQVPLSSLHANKANPRKITTERLESLKRALTADPEMLHARPLIALPDGRVIAGNMRLRAATELGWKTIPTVTVDLDDRRAQEWLLRDNREYGEWDEPSLAMLLEDLAAGGADLDLTGFDDGEVQRLLDSLAPPVPVVDPPATKPQEAQARWNVEPGHVYHAGSQTILCGDSANDTAWQALGLDSADAIWTDPPYGVSYFSIGRELQHDAIQHDAIQHDDLPPDDLSMLIRSAILDAPLRSGGACYVAAPAGPPSVAFLNPLAEAGWLRQVLVWAKQVMVFGRSDYHYQHEFLLYGWRPGAKHSWHGGRKQTSILHHDRPFVSDEHPTMKPVSLIAECLTNSTRKGDTVLDPFCGSGSTLLACEQLDRRGYAIEIDPQYVAVTLDRLAVLGLEPSLAASAAA
jgi:hypothetical protein